MNSDLVELDGHGQTGQDRVYLKKFFLQERQMKTTHKEKTRYRCDVCGKLLHKNDVVWLRPSDDEEYHFCVRRHREEYLMIKFSAYLFSRAQMTGGVIPVKNQGSDK